MAGTSRPQGINSGTRYPFLPAAVRLDETDIGARVLDFAPVRAFLSGSVPTIRPKGRAAERLTTSGAICSRKTDGVVEELSFSCAHQPSPRNDAAVSPGAS